MIVSGINLSFLSKGNDHPISLRLPISMMAHFIERAQRVSRSHCSPAGLEYGKGVTTWVWVKIRYPKIMDG